MGRRIKVETSIKKFTTIDHLNLVEKSGKLEYNNLIVEFFNEAGLIPFEYVHTVRRECKKEVHSLRKAFQMKPCLRAEMGDDAENEGLIESVFR